MGKLLPHYGNVTYSSAGQLSPLLNDPKLRTIGIGTRIFLGGGVGYVAWEGHPVQDQRGHEERRARGRRPASLALIGDLRGMSTEFVRALNFQKYGLSLGLGIGVPIPILDEDMMRCVLDQRRADLRPAARLLGAVTQPQADQGGHTTPNCVPARIELYGKKVKTSSLSSYYKARKIAGRLKKWIEEGEFLSPSRWPRCPRKGRRSRSRSCPRRRWSNGQEEVPCSVSPRTW